MTALHPIPLATAIREQAEHRSRERGTDREALQRMWVSGSCAWVSANIERLQREHEETEQ